MSNSVRRRRFLWTLTALVVVAAVAVVISVFAVNSHKSSNTAPSFSQIRMVDYFPRDHRADMWTSFDADTIDQDFGRIASLGANTVRVFVPATGKFFPHAPDYLVSRLDTLITLAHEHGLGVDLSLFDYFTAYDQTVNSVKWYSSLLRTHMDDPRITVIDLQNELTPTNPAEVIWARFMLERMRKTTGTVPLGVSSANPDTLAQAHRALTRVTVDLYDLHFYRPSGQAKAALFTARNLVAPTPLIIGETGRPSDVAGAKALGVPARTTDVENDQARYYSTVASAAQQVGLPPPAPWMLWDTRPTNQLALPARENHFGILNLDGSAKPLAASVTAAFSGHPQQFSSGSMEEGDGGTPPLPMGWSTFQQIPIAYEQDPAVAHSGHASVRIGPTEGSPDALPSLVMLPADPWVTPGEHVKATAWAKGDSQTGRTFLSITYFTASGGFCSKADSPDLKHGTSGWNRLSVSSKVPNCAAYAQVFLTSGNDSGRVWFDDVDYDNGKAHQ